MKKLVIVVGIMVMLLLKLPSPTHAEGITLDFANIFNEHGSIMLVIDASNGNIVFANLAARRFYGFEDEVWENININQINTLTPTEIEAEIRNATLEKRNFLKFKHRLASGEVRSVEVYSYPYHSEGNIYLFSIIHDVTQRNALNQQVAMQQRFILVSGVIILLTLVALLLKINHSLKQIKTERSIALHSQVQLNHVIDNLQGVVYRCKFDREFTMHYLSQGIVQLAGYEAIDLIDNKHLSYVDLIPEQYRINFESIEDVFELEYPIITKDNTLKWVMDRGKIFYDNKGVRTSMEGIISDITLRKELENKLRVSQIQLKQIASNVSEVIYLMDNDFRVQFVNEMITHIVGVSQLQFAASPKVLFEVIQGSDRQRVMDKFEEYLHTHTFNEVCAINRDGTTRWVQCVMKPIFDEQSQSTMHVGSIVDVSMLMQTTNQLQQTVNKLTKVMNNDVVGVMYWQTELGVMIDANDYMLDMIKYTREDLEMRTLNWQTLTPPEFIDLSLKEMENLGTTGKIGPYEKQYICKDGSRKWFIFTGSILQDNIAIEFCVDISNQKHEHQLLYNTQNIANVGSYTIDIASRNYFASEVLSRLLGLLHQPYRNIDDRLRWIHYDDQVVVTTLFNQFLVGLAQFDIEYRMIKEDTNEVIWIRDIAQIELNNLGEPLRVHGIIMDVSIQKQQTHSLQLQKESLSTLLHFSNAIRTINNTQALYALLIHEASKLIDSNDCAVTLLSNDKQSYRFCAAQGVFSGLIDLQISVQKGLNGWVYRENKVFVSLDYNSEKDRNQSLKMLKTLGPVVLIPLRSETQLIGVLMVGRQHSLKTTPFSPLEIETLTTLGEIAGSALHRIILFETLQVRLDYIQALHKIDVEITKGSPLANILHIALQEIARRLNVTAAMALVYNDSDVTMKLLSHIGLHDQAQTLIVPLHHHEVVERLVATKSSCFIQDLHTHTLWNVPDYLKQEHFVSYVAFPMFASEKLVGMLELCFSSKLDIASEDKEFIETIANHCAFAIEKDQLLQQLKRTNRELLHAYDATIEGWAHALDLKDQETKEHSTRVTKLTLEMARRFKVPDSELIHVRRGALLHDIGKIGIPDYILQSNKSLSEEEWKLMKQHPIFAYEMLSSIDYLQPAIDIPYYHHEKWDGTGYPLGLKHTQIPLVARIFAVVDVYDALTSDRPYRLAWTKQEALDYIVAQKESHFDPEVVNEFVKMMSLK